MTGQVFATAPPHSVSMAYSIDSFSEYSTSAVSRTPTRAIVPPTTSARYSTYMDEDLFRDLFADADGDDSTQRKSVFGVDPSTQQKKPKPNATSNKPIVWHTGSTLTRPFASASLAKSRNNQELTTLSSVKPTLDAPIPRQNAAELMTARPPETPAEEEPCALHGLARVPEVNDEDEDDQLGPKLAPQSRSVRRSLAPVNLKNHSSTQSETLQPLEKLDLKSLMAQPRPDVTSFLPPTNQNHIPYDPRVEIGSQQKPGSSWLHEGSTRLAHMAQTYGTAMGGPRKARKETLERLSNPISGYTSTLLALSPESRKKRDVEMGKWPPQNKPTTPVRTLTSKKTKDLIERLSEVHDHQESLSARTDVKKLVKGKKPLKVTLVSKSSNNQNHESTSRTSSTSRQTNIDERKALLKQKLANRMAAQPLPMHSAVSNGSTFLTQHEDLEAELARKPLSFRRSNRKLIPQRVVENKPTQDLLTFPQRPVILPSVRTRAASSTGATAPMKHTKCTSSPPKRPIRPRASSNVKISMKEGSTIKQSSKTPNKSKTGVQPPRDERQSLGSSKKQAQSTSSATASRVLLRMSTGNKVKTTLGSNVKSRGRLSSNTTKAGVHADPEGTSLPVIRRPGSFGAYRPE